MWKNVNVNLQNVEVETERAVLVKMPKNSEYKGFSFWHPKKCVRNGRHSNAISLGYTDEFEFRLVKYGKGKFNKSEIIEEKTIDANSFESAFGVMNDNIVAPSK